MKKNDIRIDILGADISISADADPVDMNEALERYRVLVEDVKKNTRLNDNLKIAVLSGFLLSHENVKKENFSSYKDGYDPPKDGLRGIDSDEAERLTLGMISLLDQAFINQPQDLPEAGGAGEATEKPNAVTGIYKLSNPVINYDWGSPEWIPALLGKENADKTPWAELWMGVNPGGPSRVISSGTDGPLLSDIINNDAAGNLGYETEGKYGKLPFLYKISAARLPLSIQVHPNMEQAREGFDRENLEGIPLDALNRNYRDPNHKPEVLCALGSFTALCGFRKILDIHTIITKLSMTVAGEGSVRDAIDELLQSLKGINDNPYRAFLSVLFNMEKSVVNSIAGIIKSHGAMLESKFPENRSEWKLSSYLNRLFPGDSGFLAPFFLNIIELQSGEAIYIPPGTLHSFIYGFGLELMADSTNVLRGGLTSKHISPDEFLGITTFDEYKPEIIRNTDPMSSWFCYNTPADEFSLSLFCGMGDIIPYPETGPSILIFTDGNAQLRNTETSEELSVKTGESLFIPYGKKLEFSGTFTAYAAAAGRSLLPEIKQDNSTN